MKVMSTPTSPGDRREAATPAIRPWVGWVLIVSGALATTAAFLTWETAGGGATRLSGIEESDGWAAVCLGLVIAIAGVMAAARRGRPWIFAAAGIAAAVLAGVFRLDENGVHTSTQPGATVGTGLWLVGIAALIGIAATVAGLAHQLGSGRSDGGGD